MSLFIINTSLKHARIICSPLSDFLGMLKKYGSILFAHVSDWPHYTSARNHELIANKTIGAPGPHYTIQKSHLPKSNASIALKSFASFALSAGMQPGAILEASIAICVKDRLIYVSPAGLGIVDKLRWLSQKHVVFL